MNKLPYSIGLNYVVICVSYEDLRINVYLGKYLNYQCQNQQKTTVYYLQTQWLYLTDGKTAFGAWYQLFWKVRNPKYFNIASQFVRRIMLPFGKD